MTVRQVWKQILTDLSKEGAPSMLLSDFNYLINKAIYQVVNKCYNIYDINQQTTDYLRVLKSTATLDPKEASDVLGTIYEVILPDDYLHLLNCICVYKVGKDYNCGNNDSYVQYAAKRLTADSWSVVINNYYNRPLSKRPYYYIHNINNSENLPTNALTETNPYGTDLAKQYNVGVKITYKIGETEVFIKDNNVYSDKDFQNKIEDANLSDVVIVETSVEDSNFPRKIKLGNPDNREVSLVNKEIGLRHGNASKVRCEIRCGKKDPSLTLSKVFIDYIKVPQNIKLTQEQLDLVIDTSQIMEFPDYVCYEIINELVTLVMSNIADPRLQSHSIVTQSIASPVQQQNLQQSRQRY